MLKQILQHRIIKSVTNNYFKHFLKCTDLLIMKNGKGRLLTRDTIVVLSLPLPLALSLSKSLSLSLTLFLPLLLSLSLLL